MEEKRLRELAEEVAKDKPLESKLDKTQSSGMSRFLASMGKVYEKQYTGYQGKTPLWKFLSYVYHEGIQLGLRLAIVKRVLAKRPNHDPGHNDSQT